MQFLAMQRRASGIPEVRAHGHAPLRGHAPRLHIYNDAPINRTLPNPQPTRQTFGEVQSLERQDIA
jgi:hypothetical protein